MLLCHHISDALQLPTSACIAGHRFLIRLASVPESFANGCVLAGTLEIEYSIAWGKKVPYVEMPMNTSVYRAHMDTIFTAPFTGVGYFVGAFDDFIDMNLTKLDSDGSAVGESERVLSSGYPGCASGALNLTISPLSI